MILTKTEHNHINKNMLRFNDDNLEALQAIVRPLFDQLGFNHFAYTRQMHGREYFSVCLDKDWTYHYLNYDLDQYLLFKEMILPKNSKRTIIWDLQPDNELLGMLRVFNHHHGVSIFVRHDDDIESWHFATDAQNTGVNNIYTNHLYLLEQFILYFQEKAKDIIDISDRSKTSVYNNNRYLDLTTPLETKEFSDFLNSVKLDKFLFQTKKGNAYLSPGEFECVKALAMGLSAKEIASSRKLSPRTVEGYLLQAREKLQVDNKTHLISLFNESIHSKFQPVQASKVQLNNAP